MHYLSKSILHDLHSGYLYIENYLKNNYENFWTDKYLSIIYNKSILNIAFYFFEAGFERLIR